MQQRQLIGLGESPKGRRSVAVILIGMTAIAVGLLFFSSLAYFKSLDRETAQTQLRLYLRSLNDTFDRHQHLPFVLAQDFIVLDALSASENQVLNLKFAQIAAQARLEAIYLMDTNGNVLASSNFDKKHSFVGQNYSFRPYFKKALSGKRGNYFGVGATTGRPGYFVSEPVRNELGAIKGIIAIKLDVSELQQSWESGGENVLATDRNGIVVLASDYDWLYRAIRQLSSQQLSEISGSKQFGSIAVTQLPWKHDGTASISVDTKSYIHAEDEASHLGWRVHFLLNDGRAQERALLTTVVFGSVITLLVGIATYLRSIRIQSALLNSQSDRVLLRKTNKKLEAAHAELAQASKLAALGQLSASVVHELGQPISAFRNYLTAEEISTGGTHQSTLKKLNGVVDRMENITKQLRFFAKPGDQKIELVHLQDVVSGAMELMQRDIELANVEIDLQIEDQSLSLHGNRLRLEQVLVNLFKNSLAALQEASTSKLQVCLKRSGDYAIITVSDNGLGIGDRNLDQLQEPFHTTRASGDGMGLGLSISSAIIKEHHGWLSAQNVCHGGAVFEVHLPIVPATGEVTK